MRLAQTIKELNMRSLSRLVYTSHRYSMLNYISERETLDAVVAKLKDSGVKEFDVINVTVTPYDNRYYVVEVVYWS